MWLITTQAMVFRHSRLRTLNQIWVETWGGRRCSCTSALASVANVSVLHKHRGRERGRGPGNHGQVPLLWLFFRKKIR